LPPKRQVESPGATARLQGLILFSAIGRGPTLGLGNESRPRRGVGTFVDRRYLVNRNERRLVVITLQVKHTVFYFDNFAAQKRVRAAADVDLFADEPLYQFFHL
jgi:hypothetical protein